MLGGRQISATLTGETMKGSRAKSRLPGGISLTHICEAWLYEVNERIDRNACYTAVYALSSSAESSQTRSRSFFRVFEYGTTLVW
jgi:hypothetical protein